MARLKSSFVSTSLSFALWFSAGHGAVTGKRFVDTKVWTPKGCYLDSPVARALPYIGHYDPGMTNEYCTAWCGQGGYPVAGTENAGECWCGNYLDAAKEPDTDCDMACDGNPSENCGGANRLTVYKYRPPDQGPVTPSVNPGPDGWTSLGCYTDSPSARTLQVATATDGGGSLLTVARCTYKCGQSGFKYAGVEYGGECWCDNVIEQGGSPATSGCNMLCNGNATEYCGGPNRLNLYAQKVVAKSAGPSPQPSPQSSGTPALPSGWQYRGCWADNVNARIFIHEENNNPSMTIESCVNTCIGLGYTVAGMEWSQQCFCDNYVRNGGAQVDESNCNMACSGQSSEICGAGNILSVYSTAALTVFSAPKVQTDNLPGKWVYQGCLTDDSTKDPRTLPNKLRFPNTNSAQTCLTQCSDYGYNAAGMEYGDECYCGDLDDVAAVGAKIVPDSQCSMACSGDANHLCGAGNLLSYYNWVGPGVAEFQYPSGNAAGMYEYFVDGPMVPLMATQTITKKVEFMEKFGETAGSTGAYELDLSTKAWRTLHVKTDVFCAAMAVLPDKAGRLLNIGGWSLKSLEGVRLFTPSGSDGVDGTTDWEENVDAVSLQVGRWYPGMIPMANGSILIMGGEDGANGPAQPSLEVLPKPLGGFVKNLPFLARTNPNNLYPFMAVLPGGGIFVQYYNEAVILDEVTFETIKQLPNVPGSVWTADGGRNYPYEGTMMLLPQYAPYTDPLEILICGGSTPAPNPAIDNCVRIQPDAANPEWVIERMPSRRVMSSMTALPDGTYLIMNGAQQGVAGFALASNPNLNAVLYDPSKPTNQRMSVMANTTIARLYHNEVTLLTDGRVLVSGSDPEDSRFPQEKRIEMFNPPYLYLGIPAPTFTVSSRDWAYGDEVTLTITSSTNPVADLKVSLLAVDAATHGNTMGQRFIFPATTCSGTTCTVTAPPNAHVCPAAWFRVFVLDGGRPSEATFVRIGGDPASIGNWPTATGFTPPGTGSV